MPHGNRLVCNVSFQLLSVFLVIIGVVDFVKLFSYSTNDVALAEYLNPVIRTLTFVSLITNPD